MAGRGPAGPDRAASATTSTGSARPRTWRGSSRRRQGEDAGAAFAYVGWHSTPGTGARRGFVLPGAPRRRRRIGALRARSRAGSRTWLRHARDHRCRRRRGSLAWVDRRGFREVGRNSRMVLDLIAIEAPAIDPPEGIEIVTWAERPELRPELYEVACEAYPDVPGEEATPMDSYEEMALEGHAAATATGPRRRSSRWSTARWPATPSCRSRARSSKVVWHDMTGVRRAFRGRGVASALKRAEIAWAKQAGYESLQTTNEVRNEPIRRLNERHGYSCAAGPRRVARRAVRAGQSSSVDPRFTAAALSARSICRLASRSAIVRRLSPLSLPRPSATSTFTLPSLK